MRNPSLILTCVLVAGCTISNTAAAALPEQRPVIAVLGDSLAEGYGVETGRSFPDLVQQKLDASGYKYRVVNLGISGDTTTGGLGRIQSVIGLKPDVVMLELGGNDGLRGLPISATRANLEAMIVAAKKAGSAVLLAGMTLPPNYGPDYIRRFEGIYKELAAKYHLTLIPFLMQDIRARIAADPGLMQRDGIHPTARGHALIAGTVVRFLTPMLKR